MKVSVCDHSWTLFSCSSGLALPPLFIGFVEFVFRSLVVLTRLFFPSFFFLDFPKEQKILPISSEFLYLPFSMFTDTRSSGRREVVLVILLVISVSDITSGDDYKFPSFSLVAFSPGRSDSTQFVRLPPSPFLDNFRVWPHAP